MSLISESDPLAEKSITASMREKNYEKQDDASSVGSHNDSRPEEFESDDDNVYMPTSLAFQIKGDDSSVGSLDEFHPEDEPCVEFYISEDEDDTYSDENDEYGSEDDDEYASDQETNPWNSCKLEKYGARLEMVDKQMSLVPLTGKATHYVFIYGYYRKREAYGGYGIIFLNNSRKPLGAYCGASKGGSYLYHLLVGIKRGLQIASKWGLPEVLWAINSFRATYYFNDIFRSPLLLKELSHSSGDVADNICLKCLRRQMMLPIRNFKILVPVIRGILQLQYNTKFRYREPYVEYLHEAAYYVAECGAKALLKDGAKVLLKKLCPGEKNKIDLKMRYPQQLVPIVEREKKSLENALWSVLQRLRRPQDMHEIGTPNSGHLVA